MADLFNPDWCLDCGTRCDEKRMCDCCVDLEESRKAWAEVRGDE